MNPKFRTLFVICGSVTLALLILQVVITFPDVSAKGILLNALPALFFYFLAYKTYHESKDGELM
ncbi:hypothetical protein SAMN05216464_10559 [Mucilaginibacter pineti]|uniref:Uncharacterized protein n=1 Tax=Mucilaginibacter pineti TaxID=1391627 RepID=A0A1G7BJW9_9SPHI|nr:hypothetical protein [Mucilaginibacter pineti]SDE27394.1 hypothetical protein SAMN05216464_10559 [Mucilaginibacter pineti]